MHMGVEKTCHIPAATHCLPFVGYVILPHPSKGGSGLGQDCVCDWKELIRVMCAVNNGSQHGVAQLERCALDMSDLIW